MKSFFYLIAKIGKEIRGCLLIAVAMRKQEGCGFIHARNEVDEKEINT